jgi:hypothetical protein
MRLKEFKNNQPDLIQAFRDFLPIAMKELGLEKLPKIHLEKIVDDTEQPTFGRFENEAEVIYLGISGRHPLDILRTLAHELVHYKQHVNGELNDQSGDTGSPEENEAHIVAGVIMRNFNKQHSQYFKDTAVSISENFADGKNPQDKGDSKRHGVPTKASVSTLRKVAKQGGRKGQLAHWMANMKAGKAKKK